MLGPLVLLLIVVPIAELYVIIQVGHVLGVVNTLALLVLISFTGAWLMKREGLTTWRRAQRQVDAGVVPGKELVDGALIVLAGALLVAPGFITDALGLLLLLPPVRAGVRSFSRRRLQRRVYSIQRYR
ncbi:MAG TPA: FxsA family protein [Acidimicrobiales bacterium]|nr:FxsA family protein [Acidimicrobiales bacterium]